MPGNVFAAVRRGPGLKCCKIIAIGQRNRKDPVQIRVAIPAADPPDNIMHDYFFNARTRARRAFVD